MGEVTLDRCYSYDDIPPAKLSFTDLPEEVMQKIFDFVYPNVNIDFQNMRSIAWISKSIQVIVNESLKKEMQQLHVQKEELINKINVLNGEIISVLNSFKAKINLINFIPSSQEEQKLCSDVYKISKKAKEAGKIVGELDLFNEKSVVNHDNFVENFQSYLRVQDQLKKLNITLEKITTINKEISIF